MHTVPKSHAGFTLFELLVVLAVMSVVSTIGVTSYNRVTGVWRVSALRMELATSAETILESIRRDMENVPSARRTGLPIQGVDVLNEEVNYRRVPLDNDRLILPIVQTNLNGMTERLAVKYHIQRDATGGQLVRTAGPMDGTEPAGATFLISDANVLSLDVQFLDGGAWKPVWTGPGHPEAVRVALTVAGRSTREVEQITRSAVFPVRVK